MMHFARGILMLLVASFVLVGCSGKTAGEVEEDKKGDPVVVTTFFPLYYLAREIGGPELKLSCPLPAGSDPIYFQPTDKDLEVFRSADLVIANGAGFEKWMDVVSLPESRVLKTAKPLAKDFIHIKASKAHSHGGGPVHTHEGLDGHTWVDLENARVQAREILDRLVVLLPDQSDNLKRRHRALDKKMADLAEKFASLGKERGSTPLLASHPAYNYLSRRIGLNMKSLDLDPESEPSESDLATIADALKGHEAKFILWESEPTAKIAKLLKDTHNLESLVFTPCEDPGLCGEDFLALMEGNFENLKRALAKP